MVSTWTVLTMKWFTCGRNDRTYLRSFVYREQPLGGDPLRNVHDQPKELPTLLFGPSRSDSIKPGLASGYARSLADKTEAFSAQADYQPCGRRRVAGFR
jgi:hypothetical protein